MKPVQIKMVGYGLHFPIIEKTSEGKPTEETIKTLEGFESALKKIVRDNPDKVVVREHQKRDLLGRIASALSEKDISVKKEGGYNADKWGETKVVFLGDSAKIRTRASEVNAEKKEKAGTWKDTFHKVSVLTAEALKTHDLIFSQGDTIYIAGGASLSESKQTVADHLRQTMQFQWV